MITLLTDMGNRDHYVAAIKAAIYSQLPQCPIVDISHDVKPFNVTQAAYLLNACIDEFPAGTVHVIGVDTEPVINFNEHDGAFPCIAVYNKQYIIANDNGFFGAFLEEKSDYKIYRIDDVLSNTRAFKFPTKNMYIPIATKLLNGAQVDDLATPIEFFKKSFKMNAVTESNLIKGHVIHVDHYGNIVTNINKELFYSFGSKTPFVITFRGKKYFIDHISNTYNEVRDGDKVAIFNDQDLLEIAINKGARRGAGGANELFGMETGEIVRVEFTPKGSRKTIESLF